MARTSLLRLLTAGTERPTTWLAILIGFLFRAAICLHPYSGRSCFIPACPGLVRCKYNATLPANKHDKKGDCVLSDCSTYVIFLACLRFYEHEHSLLVWGKCSAYAHPTCQTHHGILARLGQHLSHACMCRCRQAAHVWGL